jgi:membrane protease YdiL (CAAX protease family)
MSGNTKKASMFIALTFLFSWLLAAGFYAVGGRLGTPAASLMLVLYGFMPMTAAIVVQKIIYREALKGPLGISFRPNRWFLVAWLLPTLIALATMGVSLLLPGVEYSPGMERLFEMLESSRTSAQVALTRDQLAALPFHPFWLVLVWGLISGATIDAILAFGEELGWRGLLQRELGFLGFWRSSALIGLIWGIWHAPIIIQGYNYPQHPQAGVLAMVAFTLLFSPIFSYVRLKAKSVIATAIMHGSLNYAAFLAIMMIKGGNDLLVGVTGLAGFIVLAIVNVCIFILERRSAHKLAMGT